MSVESAKRHRCGAGSWGALAVALFVLAGCSVTASGSSRGSSVPAASSVPSASRNTESSPTIPVAVVVTDSTTPGSGGEDCCAPPPYRSFAPATARPTAPGKPVATVTSHIPAGIDGVTISPTFDEHVVDTDQDGLIDQLVLTPTVTVRTAGQYMVNTQLLDSSGGQVYSGGSGEISLVAGAQPVPLVFQGIYLFKAARWGPYRPKVTIVYAGRESATVLDGALLDQTRAYDYMQFQHDRVAVDTRSLSTLAVDTNGDGLFDELRITGVVAVDEPGVYEITSGLYGSNPFGQVAAEYMTFRLVAGPNSFTIVFKGRDIAKAGQDGPYTLLNLAIYLKAYSPTGGDLLHPSYVTPPLKAREFGG